MDGSLVPGKLAADNARLQVIHLLGAVTPGNEALPKTRLLRYQEPLFCLAIDDYQASFKLGWLLVGPYQHVTHCKQANYSYAVECPATFGCGERPAVELGVADGEFVASIRQEAPLLGDARQRAPQRKTRTSVERLIGRESL